MKAGSQGSQSGCPAQTGQPASASGPTSLMAALITDLLGMPAAIVEVAALTAGSGFIVMIRMGETLVRT